MDIINQKLEKIAWWQFWKKDPKKQALKEVISLMEKGYFDKALNYIDETILLYPTAIDIYTAKVFVCKN